MAIKCCHNCVAPKRHTACWGHCPEYLAEKEQHEKQKELDAQQRRVNNEIYLQRTDRIVKAIRNHRRR